MTLGLLLFSEMKGFWNWLVHGLKVFKSNRSITRRFSFFNCFTINGCLLTPTYLIPQKCNLFTWENKKPNTTRGDMLWYFSNPMEKDQSFIGKAGEKLDFSVAGLRFDSFYVKP